MAKRLGIVPHLYPQPLFGGLKEKETVAANRFALIEDHFAQLALQLHQGNLDGAFLSPVEYASEYPLSNIVPDVGVVSEGESESVVILFNEHLENLRSISVDPAFPSEIVLASIVMKEKYDIVPQFVPTTSSIDEALRKTDAVLAVDRIAIAVRQQRNKIDLVEEWFDLTEMPFVHGVWVAREKALTIDEIKALISAAQPVETLPGLSADEKEYLLNFRYTLDKEAIASLNEFFRMAYYHGILRDIPDVKVQRIDNAT